MPYIDFLKCCIILSLASRGVNIACTCDQENPVIYINVSVSSMIFCESFSCSLFFDNWTGLFSCSPDWSWILYLSASIFPVLDLRHVPPPWHLEFLFLISKTKTANTSILLRLSLAKLEIRDYLWILKNICFPHNSYWKELNWHCKFII